MILAPSLLIASFLNVFAAAAAAAGAHSVAPSDSGPISPEPGWPKWLRSRAAHRTDQTSGLAFLGRGPAGERVFLAADDTGDLWRLTISAGDEAIGLAPIPFRGAAAESLTRFPKADLEGVAWDPLRSRILISIEGNTRRGEANGASCSASLGIFEATLEPNAFRALRVTRLERLALPEWREASRLAKKNCGFEGIALRGDTLLLGLEAISDGEAIFSDSAAIEVFDLAAGTRAEIGTGSLGILTITGLDPGPGGRFYGVDRNGLRLFSLRIEQGRAVDFCSVSLRMPGARGRPYRIPSPESIAVDDSGFVWIAVDPWLYEPVTTEGLSRRDLANYRDGVPLLYKYRDPFCEPAPR